MKTRIIVAAILLPVFFAVLFVFPSYILTFVISAICAIAAYELLHAVKITNKRVLVYTIIVSVFTPMAVYLSGMLRTVPGDTQSALILITLLLSIAFILLCLLLIEVVLTFKLGKAVSPKASRTNPASVDRNGSSKTVPENNENTDINAQKKLKFRHIPIALAAGILIPYMLSALISLRTLPYGHLFVLLPIVAAFLTDSGAYFVGVTVGKTKAFPTISPNKTVEGYIGGIITGIVGMLIYGIILSYTTPLTIVYTALIIYGILGAIMTELGDLTFSLIKRKCGIKDYGKLIPGHGGAMDRFDSMTFAAPTMYLLMLVLPAIIYNV